MKPSELQRLLGDSGYERFLSVDPNCAQLPSFISVVAELKPAMDLWVADSRWDAFAAAARQFGVVWTVMNEIDRHDEDSLSAFPTHAFTTTRAALARARSEKTEIHVFAARTLENAEAALAAGWYPIVIDGFLVEKHLADHERFGATLGYPPCCRAFFRRRNDWRYDNTYSASWLRSGGSASIYANFLPRHGAFGFVPHIACSLRCAATEEATRLLLDVTAKSAPRYAAAAREHLRGVFLVLSELRVFRLAGTAEERPGAASYTDVEPVNPTRYDDPMLPLLRAGNSVAIDGHIVHIRGAGEAGAAVECRGDRHGPEVPFLASCR